MRGAEVFFGPALGADLDGVVLVAVVVGDLGGAAGEVGISQSVQRILHIGHHIHQTVNLVLQASDVRNLIAVVGFVGNNFAHTADG